MKYVALTSGRNEEKYVRGLVESALALDPAPEVYVIVDDASTDKTAALLGEYEKVHVVKLKNHSTLVED